VWGSGVKRDHALGESGEGTNVARKESAGPFATSYGGSLPCAFCRPRQNSVGYVDSGENFPLGRSGSLVKH
jgi:hypothetical protein